MNLSIIIINYKSSSLVLDCLQTIYTETKSISFEIIVVDNASGDDSEKKIKALYPQVQWLQMTYNSGFARANNAGIKAAKGEVLLLLNPDTLIIKSAVENAYHEFIKSIYAGCGVQLVNADGSPQISGNYAMRGGLNYLLPLPFLGKFFKWIGKFAKLKKPNVEEANDVVEVDWINGAFLMVKKEVINKTGLLDEDFFLYAEEAEWCSRLKNHGGLCIYGQFKVIHLQGETANASFNSEGKGYYNLFDRKGLQIMVSNFVRIRKEFGVFWFFLMLFFYAFEIPIFLLGLFIKNKFLGKTYSLNQWKGYSNNVIWLFRLAPKIISNKPYFYKML